MRLCVRCSAPPAITVREAAYCAPCYDRVFTDKLKNGLEAVRGAVLLHDTPGAPPPTLAIALSGGTASAVLLHAAARFFATGGHRVRLLALFVDDSDAHIEHTPRASAAAAVEHLARTLAPADFVRVPLADALCGSAAITCIHGAAARAPPHTLAPAAALQHALDTVYPPDTPRLGAADARSRAQDLARVLRDRALLAAAAHHRCAALLYGDSGTRAAAHLLADLARGGGFALPAATAPARRTHGIVIAHPLRAHLAHELAHYAAAHAIAAAPVAPLVARAPAPGGTSYEALADKTSVECLAESLIDALQLGVSSTVSTVARTGEKLVSPAPPAALTLADVPRVGSRGAALVRAACAVPCWDGAHLCTLCLLPAEGDGIVCYACWRTLGLAEGGWVPVPAPPAAAR